MESDQLSLKCRIAKYIARSGHSSRRGAEELIKAGRVALNGSVILNCATDVSSQDIIEVDGKRLNAAEKTRLFIFNKPRGCITSRKDESGRKLIFDFIPDTYPRLITVGRLDYNSEGLILMTNDGELSRRLEHPSSMLKRVYRVRAFGFVTDAMIRELNAGVTVDGIAYHKINLVVDKKQGENIWLTMTLYEGKNREIKRVLEHYGLKVSRLIRVSYGKYFLGNLIPGEIREINDQDNFGEI